MTLPIKMEQQAQGNHAVARVFSNGDMDGSTSHSLTSAPLVPMVSGMEGNSVDFEDDTHSGTIVQVARRDTNDVEMGGIQPQSSTVPSSSQPQPLLPLMMSQSHRSACRISHKHCFTALILLVGFAATVALMTTGISSAQSEQSQRFERLADEFTTSLEDAWHDYELFGLWIHEACRSKPGEVLPPTANASNLGICTRQEFRDVYEYISTFNVDFQSAQFMPNVSMLARAGLEHESRQYFAAQFPNATYRGITQLSPRENGEPGLMVVPQTERPFYWPVHYLEPVEGNEGAIELDIYSSSTQRKTIDYATSSWLPAVTDRLKLVQDVDPNAYSILLHHPGVPVKSYAVQTKPSEIAIIVIRIPALLARSARQVQSESLTVYVFDNHNKMQEAQFLGGVTIVDVVDGPSNLTSLAEISLVSLPGNSHTRHTERVIRVGDRDWIVAVESVGNTFMPDITFVLALSIIIFSATVILSFWFQAHINRMSKLNQIKLAADAEKATLLVETARKQAGIERQLNEYIAHEVRNPLSSAITALSFVSSATEKMGDEHTARASIQEDVAIVHSSLQFIDELLRNMLDMNRATDRQMTITLAPVSLYSDVLEPVASILKSRGNTIAIEIQCPRHLVVCSDPLRLKQIVLNLAMNSIKYVEQGFLRLSAEIFEGDVRLMIDDSGPGIPTEKRGRLFAKFQESLDLLDQGAGIGICLSKQLANLMNSDLFLDETFCSGISNCPGTRFVVDLKRRPLQLNSRVDNSRTVSTNGNGTVISPDSKLPESLSALFVDDDVILRKLFVRSLKRVAETWTVKEACNGETALSLCDTTTFDVIFIDQFMPTTSIEKPLLGTETVRELRSRGVTSKVCGLSANDVEMDFLENGADAFIKKPYPCEKGALEQTLLRVLYGDPSTTRSSVVS